ncbi:MarR family transcriptional regulator [Streptomyces sp. KL116D]|uniref:MarR family transcriptional regulator n=1 Tax=Streptomyces sp. KL116D TaxID=3045152 RepID=UPI00355930E3
MSRLSKRPASASDLAAIEGVRPQSMAKTVIALEQAGIDRRSQDPDDGRRQLVALTELPRSAGRASGVRPAGLARPRPPGARHRGADPPPQRSPPWS